MTTKGTTRNGDGRQRQHDEAVLRDRKDRLIGCVGDLVLAGLAVEHCTLLLPSDAFDDAFAEQALRPDQQEQERQHAGEPDFDTAAHRGAEEHLGDLFARPDDQTADDRRPGTEVKPPRISTGNAFSASSDSENCTPSLLPHTAPAASATRPATSQTTNQM